MNPRRHWTNSACPAIWALAAALLGGCATRINQPATELFIGPSYQPSNIYFPEHFFPTDLRRVAVLPLVGDSSRTELADGRDLLEDVVQKELGKTKRFEVVRVVPADLESWTGRKSWSSAETLPPKLMAALREKLGCDGVLFSELTQFQAYPPLVVGWNLKLVELRTQQICWAADEVFDASQPAVVNGARRYQLRQTQITNPLVDSRQILLSPTAFGHYTAETLFASLAAQ